MYKEKILKICDLVIESSILAIVFFIPIIFDYSLLSYNIFDLYKAIIFRIILIFILLAFTAKVFITGQLIYRGSAKIFLLAAFLLLSFFVSSYFSLYPNQSFWGSFLRQQGFYNFFNYLLFFVLLILNIENLIKLNRIIITVTASAFLVSTYGLVQYFGLDPFSWSESSVATGRIFSTLGQPNFFGHWLIIVMPLSLYTLIFIAKKSLSKFFVSLALFMQLACLVFTYSRAAWLGFLGSIIFLIMAWLFYKRFKKVALSFIGLILIGVIFVIGLNIINPVKSDAYNSIGLINRLKSITDLKSGSSKIRLYSLESAIKEIRQESKMRLLIGYGPEVLGDVFMKYYQIDWGVYEAINSFPDRAHNWLFDQILALGFFGLAINLIFYVYFIYKAAIFLSPHQRIISARQSTNQILEKNKNIAAENLWRGDLLAKHKFEPDDWLLLFLLSSLIAYCINNLFSFSLFTVLVYLYLILAIGWVIINFKTEIKTLNIRLTVFSKLLIFVSVALVALVFIYTNNINQARAEIYYVRALNQAVSPNCGGVINNMEKVISLSPSSRYYQENYLFLTWDCFYSTKDISIREQLKDNMLEQIKSINDKKYYSVLHNTARVYTLFGFYFDKTYYTEAEKIFNDLIKNYPYFPMFYEDLSKQKIMQEDYAGAIEVLNQGIKILPSVDHPHLNDQHRQQISNIAVRLYESLGQAYFKIKNYDLALEAYKKGLKFDPYRSTLYKNIADIYYVQNNLDEAIKFNQRGFMLSLSDYHWPLALSLLYRDKKDLELAKEYLNKALELAPENEDLKKYKEELDK